MEEVVAGGEVLKTNEIQVAEVIAGLESSKGGFEAEASGVSEEVVSEVATNLTS